MILRTALVALVVAALATGCGESEPEKPTEAQGRWVDAFCAGMLPGLEAGLELKAQKAEDYAAVKAAYLKLVAANVTGLGEAERKLKEIGVPSPAAKDVHNQMVTYFGESSRSYAAAQAPVQALEANAEFWAGAEEALKKTSLVSRPEDLRGAFDALGKMPVYADLMTKSVPCTEITAKSQNLGTK